MMYKLTEKDFNQSVQTLNHQFYINKKKIIVNTPYVFF